MVKNKVALVLGSGSARGVTHIGVIKELEKNNIPIDMIVGCSIGAIVGAHYSLNLDIFGTEKLFTNMKNIDLFKLIDFNKINKSLIKGDKVEKFFEKIYSKKSFKDTQIPFFVVATNFQKGEIEVIKKGSLAKAVRGSVSVPGIFSPFKLNKKILVDGGLLNPTPVDVAKKLGANKIIAVDLPFMNDRKCTNLNFIESIFYSYEMLRKELVIKDKNTVIIKPDFKNKYIGFKFNDKSLIKIGEKATQKKIKAIKKIL